MSTDPQCVDHFRAWLRNQMAGCHFAASIAAKGRVSYAVHVEELKSTDTDGVNRFFDEAGAGSKIAVALFPRVRTSRGIARMIATLNATDRWNARSVEWGNDPREGATLVGLQFKTALGDLSSIMGFAPLGCMPVTRRAPYVAIAGWTGKKPDPPIASSRAGTIGFIDAPAVDNNGVPLDDDARQVMWDATKERVQRLLGDPVEDSVRLRQVAFCLPESCKKQLFSDGALSHH